MKAYLSTICLTIICYTHIFAQDNSAMNYLQQTGIYAELYCGKMETAYNSIQYENLPYYINADFTDAAVIYKKNYFPNQKVRLDLFKEQLIILSPEKQYGIILNSQYVEKVMMYNKTFVLLTPPKESGLKTGYYIQLLDKEKMQFFCKESYTFEQRIRENIVWNSFNHKIRYYLCYNDRYYTIRNKRSFSKIFPQYKKQINAFVNDNRLNFKQNTMTSLTALAAFCEGLEGK